jgi:hypothetical protein
MPFFALLAVILDELFGVGIAFIAGLEAAENPNRAKPWIMLAAAVFVCIGTLFAFSR